MNNHFATPPNWSLRLIRALVRDELQEEIEGNLYEYYQELCDPIARWPRVRYAYEVLLYLRLSTLKHVKLKNLGLMFHFNPRVTLRHLLQQRASTGISLLGFVVGLVSVFFLYFYISYEGTVDSFHTHKNDTYRVLRTAYYQDIDMRVGVTSGLTAEALTTDFPHGILDAHRARTVSGLVQAGEKTFREEGLLMADPNLFTFFDFPLAVGDPQTVLQDHRSVVISESLALKYFGEPRPLGKTLSIDQEEELTVTGILGPKLGNSHLDFDLVMNIKQFDSQGWMQTWFNNAVVTYIRINPTSTVASLEEQFPAFLDKYLGEEARASGSLQTQFKLEPLTAIYFNADTRYDPIKHGNRQNLVILSFVALAILAIACFNYVNLAIAHAQKRVKEVSVRKVLGVTKSRLVFQFMSESLVVIVLGLIAAGLLTELLTPLISGWFGVEVPMNWTDSTVVMFVSILLGGILLLSGLYPALLLSSFQTTAALKSSRMPLGRNLLVRKGLVVMQFTLSIFMIIVTLLVSVQLNFLQTKELGFDQESIVLFPLDVTLDSAQAESALNLIRDLPQVTDATVGSGTPGGFHDATSLEVPGVEDLLLARTAWVDSHYLTTYGIQTVAGSAPNPEMNQDMRGKLYLNEAAMGVLGLEPESLIGEVISLADWGEGFRFELAGVVQDYHYSSLRDVIEPLVIIIQPFPRMVAVRTTGQDMAQTLEGLEEIYAQIAPGFPLNYSFQDETLNQLYAGEQQQARVFSSFSMISILLACMGILGLAAFAAQRRQKELGIRKVLGASVQGLMGLISKEFMLLVLVAVGVAIPTAWYFMDQWLADFAYRITLLQFWYIFLGGGLLALLITFLTIGLRTYRAAVRRPTESIRYE
ncbi:MAG: FtsX-like permease family protein [Bacteroidota bacterium]